MNKINLLLFTTYSYLYRLIFLFLDISPYPVRHLIYKLLLNNLGKNTMIDYGFYVRYPSKVSVGNNVTINRKCQFYTSFYYKNTSILIKDNVAIGPNVILLGAGHATNSIALIDTAGSIVIEKNCWICANSIILQNITIGEGAIVAAGSIVTKNVEPYSIVGGVPAKFIRFREISS